jgi:hypothetical protein
MRVFCFLHPPFLLDADRLLLQTERVLRSQVLHLQQQAHELNAN